MNDSPELPADAIAESGRYWDSQFAGASTEVLYWLAVPPVRAWVNRRMTGDPEKLFIQHYLESFRDRWPLPRALSIGCGTGDLERGVAGLGAVDRIDGVDVGERNVETARRQATEQGLSGRVRYERTDTASFLRAALARGDRYDLVFFHAVLHHLTDLEEVAELTGRILRRDVLGQAYIDEYMGPSRDEWTEEHLGYAKGLFALVPEEHRRTPHVWPPIAIEDPTEMIRSSEIEPVFSERLRIVRFVPYYGNVLNPLVSAIRGTSFGDPRVRHAIEEAMRLEEHLIAREIVRPLYAVAIAEPR